MQRASNETDSVHAAQRTENVITAAAQILKLTEPVVSVLKVGLGVSPAEHCRGHTCW